MLKYYCDCARHDFANLACKYNHIHEQSSQLFKDHVIVRLVLPLREYYDYTYDNVTNARMMDMYKTLCNDFLMFCVNDNLRQFSIIIMSLNLIPTIDVITISINYSL